MKKLVIFGIILCISTYYLLVPRLNAPKQIYPYPYIIKNYPLQNIDKAEKSDILIMGDKMALSLDPYLKNIIPELSKGLESQINIFNWADEFEGIHRSLHKLKSLKNLPRLIIYHGASTEFYEQKINAQNYKKIKRNFDIIENDILLSLIMVFPWLSKFIYSPIQHRLLDSTILKSKKTYSDIDSQRLKELKFKIFNFEFLEFIEKIIDQGSTLITVTTPINYDVAPKSQCHFKHIKDTKELMLKVQDLIDKNDTKSADKYANKLLKINPTDPFAHFYKAKINLVLGNKVKSLKHSQLASVYDCKEYRANAVYNSIIEKHIKNYDLNKVDFYKMMNDYNGRETLFIDDIYPQNIYYKEIMVELTKKIKKILRLR